MRCSYRRVTVAVATLALAVACAGSSFASPVSAAPATGGAALAAVQALAAAAIAGRQSALNAAIAAVNSNTFLTSTDKSTALATLTKDLSGLTALAPTIAADTTFEAAESSYLSIFTTYRVYALALPQTFYAAAADDVTTDVLPALTAGQTGLTVLLHTVDASKDTTTVQGLMSNLATELSDINSSSSGLSGSLLALTPAQWNANHALLSGPRSTLVTIGEEAAAVTSDESTVAADLQ